MVEGLAPSMPDLPPHGITYLADLAVLEGGTCVHAARIDVDAEGIVVRCGRAADIPCPPLAIVRDLGRALVVPGFVNAHSHAFQRAMRGRTHRLDPQATDPRADFWSWRAAMYQTAAELTPDTFEALCLRTFREMVASGITCVGEFHYLHHAAGGTPYADPNELSWRVVSAARRAGLRLVLLEVFYARGGPEVAPTTGQRRFCDVSVAAYLKRVDDLRTQGVAVGIAPHSVRAVAYPELMELVRYAQSYDLPIHIHLSEQPRENDECRAEHGITPTGLLARSGALDRPGQTTAVHAIHLAPEDYRQLSGHQVCACPTTEADLGDGILDAVGLRDAGVTLALGSDSNAIIDLVQEARLLEMHERLRSHARCRLSDAAGHLGEPLLSIASAGGAKSLGMQDLCGAIAPGRPFDAAVIACDHPMLADVATSAVLDAVFTSGTAGVIRGTIVGGVES